MFMKQIQSEMGVHSLVDCFRHSPHVPPPLNIYVSVFSPPYPILFLCWIVTSVFFSHVVFIKSSKAFKRKSPAYKYLQYATEYTEVQNNKEINSYLKIIQVFTCMYNYTYDCALLGIWWQFRKKKDSPERTQLKHYLT